MKYSYSNKCSRKAVGKKDFYNPYLKSLKIFNEMKCESIKG